MELRRPHIKRYQTQLRDALLNPSLSAEQRADIHVKLASIGQPKPYAELAAKAAERLAKTLPPPPTIPTEEVTQPGAVESNPVEPEPTPTSGETLDDLLDLTKDELLALAESEGVEAFKSWTKAQIAEAILEHRSAG
jgi:hypothetical protein